MNHTTSQLSLLRLIDRIVVRDIHAAIFKSKYGGRLDILLPPVMVGCQFGDINCIGETINNLDEQEFHPLLRKKLEELGPIGDKRSSSKNIIGKCAENDAANQVLMEDYNSSIIDLKQLWFTDSIRPRTFQVIPPCKNCEDVFSSND